MFRDSVFKEADVTFTRLLNVLCTLVVTLTKIISDSSANISKTI